MVKLLYILDLVSVQHDTLSGAGQAGVQQHSGLLLRGHHRHSVGPHQGRFTYLQYSLQNLQCLHYLCVQKAEAGVLQRLEGHLGYVTSLLWVGGGGLLVSASWDHTVKVMVRVICPALLSPGAGVGHGAGQAAAQSGPPPRARHQVQPILH